MQSNSTHQQMNRRDFMKVASAAGTGLVLSFSLPTLSRSDELEPLVAEPFAPNAWLKINANGTVTVTVAKSEMGQGVQTSLPMIVAEELEADWTKVRFEQAPAHPNKYGSQGTGGSSSVRTSYERLRKAGATAREMLIAAGAQRWNVDASHCYAEKNMVVHRPSGRKLSYGELAEAAAKLPIPENPPLKDPKDFRIIGTRVKKLDTPSKVNGSAIFGIDVKVPGMLYATIARCPVFGGKVASFDANKAKQVNGVKDVVQFDEGIAVLANSTWAAIKGREALSIKWDEGEYANQSSASIWKMFEEAAKSPGTVEKTVGDPAAALQGAAKKIGAVYYAPFVAHATMEPMNCLAHVRGNECEIWAPSQTPQRAQTDAAKVLGVPTENVTVHVTLLGGGFGRRLQTDYAVEAVKVSKAAGAPVKVIWTREDDMMHDFYRPCTYNVLSAGLDKEGWPIAWTQRVVGPSSKGIVMGGAVPEYTFPNLRVDYHIKETGVPIGAWRSVGHSQNIFVIESFMDELAAAAKMDPLEYRLHLMSENPRLKRVLEVAAEKAGWAQPIPKGWGRGIACGLDFGTAVAEVAEVSVESNGSLNIHRLVVAVDCGPYVNPDTIEAQVEGAIVYGLTAALKGEITIGKGRVQQENFDTYPILRINEMPKVEVHLLKTDSPMGGIGEPGLPPAAPAVCNAIFAATGKRVRRLPIHAQELKMTKG